MYFLSNASIIQNIYVILFLELPSVKKTIFLFSVHTLFSTKNCISKLTLFPITDFKWLLTVSEGQITTSKDDFLYSNRLHHINVLTNSTLVEC